MTLPFHGSNASGFKSRSRHFAGIAQLAVRITCNDEVIGSSPIVSSLLKSKNKTFVKNILQANANPLRRLTAVQTGRDKFSAKGMRDLCSYRRGSRFMRRSPAKMRVCDASNVVGCGRGKRQHVRLYRYADF